MSKKDDALVFGSDSWNAYYKLAKEYYEKHGNLNIDKFYRVVKDDDKQSVFYLATWILAQKTFYDNDTRNIPEKYLHMLDDIDIGSVSMQSLLGNALKDEDLTDPWKQFFDDKDKKKEDLTSPWKPLFKEKEKKEADPSVQNYQRRVEKKSITSKRTAKAKKRSNEDLKKRFKILIGGVIVGLTICGGALLFRFYIDNTHPIDVAKEAAYEICEDYGLASKTDDDIVLNPDNTPQDFAELHIDCSDFETTNAIRGFYEVLNDDKEQLNSFIQGMTYENGLYNFTDFQQFLTYFGYNTINKTVDPNNRVASTSEFIKYTGDALKEMSDEEIISLVNSCVNSQTNKHTKG